MRACLGILLALAVAALLFACSNNHANSRSMPAAGLPSAGRLTPVTVSPLANSLSKSEMTALRGHKTPKAAWLALSEDQKLSAVGMAIWAYETGWADGYYAPALRFEVTGGTPGPEPADPNKAVTDMRKMLPTFSHPIPDYVAAITDDCLKTGCRNGIMWILPCMADNPTTTHGLPCHINVRQQRGGAAGSAAK